MCGRIAMCKCTKSCNKTTYFVSKRNSIEKETSNIFGCTVRFSLQSLSSTIRLFKVFFGDNYRSSHPEVFFRKCVFKNSAKFIRKHLFKCNFIRKEIPIFLWILQNFEEHLFYRTPPVAASVISIWELFFRSVRSNFSCKLLYLQ